MKRSKSILDAPLADALMAQQGTSTVAPDPNLIQILVRGHGATGESGQILVHAGMVISGNQDSTIKLWHYQTGDYIATLHGHKDWVTSFCAFGDLLVSGSRDEMVRIWDLRTGNCRAVAGLGSWVMTLAGYSVPFQGDRILAGLFDGRIVELSLDGAILREQRVHTGVIKSLVVHGQLIYSAAEDLKVHAHNLADGTHVGTFQPTGLWPNVLRIYGNSIFVAGHQVGPRVRQWKLDGTFVREYSCQGSAAITGLFIAGEHMVTTSYEGIKLWNVETGQVTRVLHGRYGYTIGSPEEGHDFLTASNDRVIRKWNGTTFDIEWATPPNFGYSCPTIVDSSLICGRDDGSLCQLSRRTGMFERFLNGHSAGISAIVVQGSWLFAAGHDHTVRCFNLTTGFQRAIFTGLTTPAIGLAIHGDNLFTGTWNGCVVSWSIETGVVSKTWQAHQGQIASLCMYGDYLFTAEHSIRMWDARTGELVKEFNGHTGTVFAMTIRYPYLFSGGYDKKIRGWNVQTGNMDYVINTSYAVMSLAVGEAHLYAGLGYGGNDIHKLSLSIGHEVSVYSGHTAAVTGLCLESQTRILYSTSVDGTVREWHA